MALKIGDTAPTFNLESTSGKRVSFPEDFNGKSLILYFYPKDFTRVCTAEACEFRDEFSAFRDLEADILGISRDDIPTHLRFKKEYRLPFELLSDPTGKICKAYDALIPLIKMPKRITYLIDPSGKIAGIYADMFESKLHVEAMLRKLSK
jgi:peroxiredoxin Q/BCP